MIKKTLSLLFLLISFSGFSQDFKYLPTHRGQIIKHRNYILSYDEKFEQAQWVAYELNASETQGAIKRADNFRPDPIVKTGSANLKDYKGSGYDGGHLAPAADMGFSALAMSESFYMSNMSPQKPSFNRGIWKNLETQVRNWAKAYDKIYVVTGAVLKLGLPIIGKNMVAIPEKYYKIIFREKAGHSNMIAFLMANKKSEQPLSSFVVSVDQLEKLTGLNFFPQLPDGIENKLEAQHNELNWRFGSSKGYSKTLAIAKSQTKTNNAKPYAGQCCGKIQKRYSLQTKSQCMLSLLLAAQKEIGRRAGLKHQWGNPCRFDPGPVYKNPRKQQCLRGFYFLGERMRERFRVLNSSKKLLENIKSKLFTLMKMRIMTINLGQI
jgi:endonuclease G